MFLEGLSLNNITTNTNEKLFCGPLSLLKLILTVS